MAHHDHDDGSKELTPAETRQDQSCWTNLVSAVMLAAGFLATVLYAVWESPAAGTAIRTYSFEYFVACAFGGVLSGLPHSILTPMDLVKCRIQTGEYKTASEGYGAIWAGDGSKAFVPSPLARLRLFYRGLAPTFIGYSMQGAAKFGLYELFKFRFALALGFEFVKNHRILLFLLASASAEVFADVLLCPWEAVKVKMQTTRIYVPTLSVVAPRMFALEGWQGLYKGLVPLWMRQVPYTVMKFVAFEKIIEAIYSVVPKATTPASAQLLISLIAGFSAGVLCALVSHPADSVVSKLNQKSGVAEGGARTSVMDTVRDMGCGGLWKGLVARLLFVGTLTAMQWLIYDSFKVSLGLQTTGGAAPAATVAK